MLAVGVSRRWRDAVIGAVAAVVVLAVVAALVGPVLLGGAAARAAADRGRGRTAAVRPGVAAQGRAAARRAPGAVELAEGVPRGARGDGGAAPAAARQAGLARAGGGVQGRGAGRARGRADRGRARRRRRRGAGAGGLGRRGADRAGDRGRRAPAAGAAAGVAPEVRGRAAADVVRRVLPRRRARTSSGRAATSRCVYVALALLVVSQLQVRRVATA